MKRFFLKPALLLVAVMTLSLTKVSAQIGPVVSVSETENSIPTSIKSFFNKYYNGISMSEIELKTLENVYEIKLSNGFEFKFQPDGQWIEVDAPQGAIISSEVVSNLLPVASVEHLLAKDALNKINEMSYNPQKGYKAEVEKRNGKEKDYYFDLNGKSYKCHDKKDKKCKHQH